MRRDHPSAGSESEKGNPLPSPRGAGKRLRADASQQTGQFDAPVGIGRGEQALLAEKVVEGGDVELIRVTSHDAPAASTPWASGTPSCGHVDRTSTMSRTE